MRPAGPQGQQLRLREQQIFLVLSIVIGILAGLSAVLFSVAIEQVSYRFFGLAPSPLRLFIVPPLVSLLTGVLLTHVFPEVRGSGVPQTKAAYHLAGGVIPARVPLGKFITGVLCIGSGHSLGREGPSVQIGAGLASAAGGWMRVPASHIRDLVPVGAAGALAAAFNTPVAAVLFALEEIIGDMNAALLGSAVVASVASVVVQRSILGNEPLFHVPEYQLVHPAELVAYAALGIAGGLVSLAFCKGLLGLRALFRRMPPGTVVLQPAIGGLAIGALLVYWPPVMGVGYEYVDQALNGELLVGTLAALCFLKLGATIISYASGNAGGIFAPSLYIGAMVGGALGIVVNRVAPFPTADAGAYALVGMGTLFAGIVRAPMTSVFMIFEITQDYQILVPLMVANMLSFVISRRYQPQPIYHALLRQDGVHLPSRASQIASRARSARHVMHSDVSLIPPESTAGQAWAQLVDDEHSVYLVGTRDALAGRISRQRLAEAAASGASDRPVAELAEPITVHVHADHSLDVVLDRFDQSEGLLPVVSRSDIRRIEGAITVDSIVTILDRQRHQGRSR